LTLCLVKLLVPRANIALVIPPRRPPRLGRIRKFDVRGLRRRPRGAIGPPEIGIREICPPQVSPLQRRALKLSPLQRHVLEQRAIERCALKLSVIERRNKKLSVIERRALKLRANERRALKLRVFERRALKLRIFERRALKLSTIERRALQLRAKCRGALKVSASKVDFRQASEIEYRSSQIAVAYAKDIVSPLHLFRIVDLEPFIDVDAEQDERAGKGEPAASGHEIDFGVENQIMERRILLLSKLVARLYDSPVRKMIFLPLAGKG